MTRLERKVQIGYVYQSCLIMVNNFYWFLGGDTGVRSGASKPSPCWPLYRAKRRRIDVSSSGWPCMESRRFKYSKDAERDFARFIHSPAWMSGEFEL